MSRSDATPSCEEDETMNGLDVALSYEENQEGRRFIVGSSFRDTFDSPKKFERKHAFHPAKGSISNSDCDSQTES